MEATDGARLREIYPKEFLNIPLLKVMDLGATLSRFLETNLGDLEVSLTEVRILAVCAAYPGCTAVEISRIFPVDPPAVSRAVHSMAQSGLVTRRRSRSDRREVRLRPTDAGLALLDECRLLLEQCSAEFTQSLDEDQRRSLRSAVEVLLGAGS